MPLVQIKGVGGYLNMEQKQEMLRKVTDAVLSVEGEGLRPVGVAGEPVTDDNLRQMAAQDT